MGGAIPTEAGTEIVLSLSRMNKVRDIDPVDMTVTAEAGVTLKTLQNLAAAQDMLPLSMSSEMSAQIGGVLSTNAGGNNTVRFGNAEILCWGWRSSFLTAGDGTDCGVCARTIPDTRLRQLFVGARGRSA